MAKGKFKKQQWCQFPRDKSSDINIQCQNRLNGLYDFTITQEL